ncbi:efflux RND transporter periplasmic adaptor subunit [Colwellia sp. 20A7]|uniref:efflux RND transporter periplasmic adaptor subunit n=1 Tax=Colwellia sp. 20A7 TaxID=2689569 RepID=UPI002E29F838|nr:efflux RND transporter periplasmic adaptor subunit [Colwellia sp. 20A7]
MTKLSNESTSQSMNRSKQTSKVKKIIIPIVILVATYILIQIIINNPPEANRGGSSAVAKISVETLALKPKQYPIVVNSFGTVQPRTSSVLVAQVSGEINEVSPQFRDGGFFEKGDVLVQLDDRDHRAEVKITQSSLLSAKQALLEEEARAKQALIDWERLGNGAQPNVLVLREPQLAAAQAEVLSAQANLDKAELLLERTKIVAPFAGRVLKKLVDLGRVVTSNTQLADIYAIDYVEIRLPINNKELSFIALPEEYRSVRNRIQGPSVEITSDLIGKQSWQGEIVRTEGAIDENSQQLYIVAQIDDPYDISNKGKVAPIKIGQYVNAAIVGKTIEQALVIPNSSIYQGSYVYIAENIDDETVLQRKEITIRWQNDKDAIIESGLSVGDELVLTALGQVSSGTPVEISGANAPAKSKLNKQQRNGNRGDGKRNPSDRKKRNKEGKQ